jgi:WD40 repeat protein
MVHVFTDQDLCEKSAEPIRTWSRHELPVTSLVALPGGRLASGGADGRVNILEICSGAVLASIKIKHGIQCLQSMRNQVFAGCKGGRVVVIDLDEYAMYQTEQAGGIVKTTSTISDAASRIFGGDNSAQDNSQDSNQHSRSYMNELQGHSHSISSLTVWQDVSQSTWLASGDTVGTICIWDVQSRGCVRVIRLGSTESSVHPVTSLHLVEFDDSIKQDHKSNDAKANGSTNSLSTPLQSFPVDKNELMTPLPRLSSTRSSPIWNIMIEQAAYQEIFAERKRKRNESGHLQQQYANDRAETKRLQEQVRQLQEQLEESQTTIKRWEAVNNKLMTKLKK